MIFARILAAVAALALAGPAFAQDDGDADLPPPVKARHGHMDLNAFNLGILGGMAKGEITYDAGAARAAAANLAALSRLDETAYWVEGTDSSVKGSRALPKIWDNMADFHTKMEELTQAATEMAKVAGEGQEALAGGMKALGGACSSCHKAYREPD